MARFYPLENIIYGASQLACRMEITGLSPPSHSKVALYPCVWKQAGQVRGLYNTPVLSHGCHYHGNIISFGNGAV